jgi:hypothetical protein
MYRTYFKDRRTGAVYVTTERTIPTTGLVPLKPAYKEDTVWVEHSHLERVTEPHIMSPLQGVWMVFLFLLWLGFWVFTSHEVSNEFGMNFASALVTQAGWTIVGFVVSVKWSGLTHI